MVLTGNSMLVLTKFAKLKSHQTFIVYSNEGYCMNTMINHNKSYKQHILVFVYTRHVRSHSEDIVWLWMYRVTLTISQQCTLCFIALLKLYLYWKILQGIVVSSSSGINAIVLEKLHKFQLQWAAQTTKQNNSFVLKIYQTVPQWWFLVFMPAQFEQCALKFPWNLKPHKAVLQYSKTITLRLAVEQAKDEGMGMGAKFRELKKVTAC